MKKIKTLEDALSLVPTHFPLVPGVDKWKEGDEVFNDGYNTIGWLKVHPCNYGNFIEGQNCYRRPIPQSVREAEARWVLYNSLADGKPQEYYFAILLVPDIVDDESLSIAIGEVSYGSSAVTFSTKEKAKNAMRKLGGESAVIQMLTEGPGALFRWVQENRK